MVEFDDYRSISATADKGTRPDTLHKGQKYPYIGNQEQITHKLSIKRVKNAFHNFEFNNEGSNDKGLSVLLKSEKWSLMMDRNSLLNKVLQNYVFPNTCLHIDSSMRVQMDFILPFSIA